jgi:transcription initiation factor TFIIIB Brf1 subunit/transcription initiation factor TFIIB
MSQNQTTSSNTTITNAQQIIADIAPIDEHRVTAENILSQIKYTNYAENNPVKTALAALVIAGEHEIEPIITDTHLEEYGVQVETLHKTEIVLRKTINKELTADSDVHDEAITSLTSKASDEQQKRNRVHSHIESIGTALKTTTATINKAHEVTRVTQPRDHNAELIAGAAVYFAGHYTGNDRFSQQAIGEVMDCSLGNIGRISAHLAGFNYWSRKHVDESRNINSLPISTYISEYCDELGVQDAVEKFAMDLLIEFEVLDGRWHLPQNVGIPVIDTALEVIGITDNHPTTDVYPVLPTEQAIQTRKEKYLTSIGTARATRRCAKYVVEDITSSDDIESQAKQCIDAKISDVRVIDMSALETAEFAVKEVTVN